MDESDALLARAGVPARLPTEATQVLVQLFRELRSGRAGDEALERLHAPMSTAEAVSAAMTAALESAWFGDGESRGSHLTSALLSVAIKDEPDDRSRLRAYLERQVKGRPGLWREIYDSRHLLDGP